ncbi:MAG: iron chelate uptake ABC transporter family permease subunit [Propionibacteriales bacterium]|nr:iron chelate uptake ABC transporter family permease subunit [Propionibacteriales bacterium]
MARPEISFRIELHTLWVLLAFGLVATVALVVSVAVGEFPISPAEVVRTVVGRGEPQHAFIVMELRLPRAIVAFAVGAALGAAGVVFQGLTRNGLAAPEIIGVAAGANLAAVVVIVILPDTPLALLPVAAMAGALVATALVYRLAWRGGTSPVRLILVGIAMTMIGHALVMAVVSTIDEVIHASQLVIFMAGSVYGKGWPELTALAPWILVLLPLAVGWARHLDVLRLGDHPARGLGAHVERERFALMAIAAGLAGAAVAIAGPVGFVGLMAPHIARRLVGAAHAAVLPVAAMAGGTIVILADALARTLFAPVEIPVGVMTAIVGAPFFLVLLFRITSHTPGP